MSDEPTTEDYRTFLKIMGYPPNEDETIKLKPNHRKNPYILKAVEGAKLTIIQ